MAQNNTYRTLLDEFIAFRSISTDPSCREEMTRTALWLKEQFASRGFQVDAIEGYGNPIVVARYDAGREETVLIYGHYDVQPAEKADGWSGDPFAVRDDGERLYARGIVDNKGQVLVHIATVFDLIEKGALGHNVVFMIEGDEETGSDLLPQFLAEHRERLAADWALISDGETTAGRMTLELGFRGGFNATVTVTTSHTDLHSGLYGGATPSASWTLSHFLAGLHDDRNVVAIDHFYDDVDPIDEATRKKNQQLPFSEEEFKRLSGTRALKLPEGADFHSQVGLQPTVEITGVTSGYTGDGYKNAIPARATAKINFRLVARQDPRTIAEQFSEYARRVIPDYADVVVDVHGLHDSIKLPADDPHLARAAAVIEKVIGEPPLYKFCGGGLPIVAEIARTLAIPQVLLPLANEDCAMHGVEENFKKDDLRRAQLVNTRLLASFQ
ncbi:M20/M25/M40 family metallo-hydrolase [Patescibacteria group bacterium]|jgi:acetylornithine deacetylase/succinyl-diaminopimelate desuccinylase-like protein|nr:M20/M25/M40 family metallo-hydrolase [Patescibacteria group bacterium]